MNRVPDWLRECRMCRIYESGLAETSKLSHFQLETLWTLLAQMSDNVSAIKESPSAADSSAPAAAAHAEGGHKQPEHRGQGAPNLPPNNSQTCYSQISWNTFQACSFVVSWCHIRPLCLYLRHQFRHGGKSNGKGGRPVRGRVPRRTCRRSNYCGFAEVLGLFRAELYGINIGLGELNMTAWSFRTSLTKWDHVTRSNSWDIDGNI